MNDYNKYSFWLDNAGEDLTPRAPLTKSEEFDVVVLGGGYTGLWTAYYLLKNNPGLSVAVVEKEIVGFGASGRNGGWCSSKFPVTPKMLEARFGLGQARALMLAMVDTVNEIQRFCDEEQVDAHFHKGGLLTLARGAHQLPVIQASFQGYLRLGLGEQYRLLSAAEANEKIRVTNVFGALSAIENASVHPARLVRGLARAVEKRGGVIYEQTKAERFVGGSKPRLITQAGDLVARKGLALAGEAYLTQMQQLHRSLLPVYSLIAITEPLSASAWSQIGWSNRESVASARLTVDYLTKTADGRILFGSRGAPYRFGSKISDEMDRHEETHSRIEKTVTEWFPMLKGVRFTHRWGGPVGMPRDWMPMVHFDPDSRIGTARGYTGQGVSTTNLTGRVLATLISGKRNGLETLCVAQRKSPLWEPEPLRWIAVRYAQNAILRIDESEEKGSGKPWDAPVAEFLGKH